ncbi:PHD finger protein 20 isoform X2 [Ambystoma mexicanum]|uniref:PHD finger protein 20 isoform X2 n=1 Tax=Ambystoma mexicanum TaxID=8296 RepID=UPI0037E7CC00
MTKNPPNRRGITFEVGAQLEARDRLKKWYAALIEEINFEEGKVLIHFKHWNHRHDEWFCWDSPDLRPEEKIQLRKEGLHEEPVQPEFRVNQQVLACWSDCRFYPAKVTAANKDGTYTVKYFDGVVQNVKNIHVKSCSKDQNATYPKPKERNKDIISRAEKSKERCNELRNSTEKNKKVKDEQLLNNDKKQDANKEKLVVISEESKTELDEDKISQNSNEDHEKDTLFDNSEENKKDRENHKSFINSEKSRTDYEKQKIIAISEKSKISEMYLPKNEKEDKENISEHKEILIDKHTEDKTNENSQRTPHEKIGSVRKRSRQHSSPTTDPASQTLQPIILELRRRKISISVEVHPKRPRLEKRLQDAPSINSAKTVHSVQIEEKFNTVSDSLEKAKKPRRSSRLSSNSIEEMIHVLHVPATPKVLVPLKEQAFSPNETSQDDHSSVRSQKLSKATHNFQKVDKLHRIRVKSKKAEIPRRSSRLSSSGVQEMFDVTSTQAAVERLKEQVASTEETPEDLPSILPEQPVKPMHSVEKEERLHKIVINREKDQKPRRSSRFSSSGIPEILDVTPPQAVSEPLKERIDTAVESPEDLPSIPPEQPVKPLHSVEKEEELHTIVINHERDPIHRRSSRLCSSGIEEMLDDRPPQAVSEPLKERIVSAVEPPEDLPSIPPEQSVKPLHSVEKEEILHTIVINHDKDPIPRRSSRLCSSAINNMFDVIPPQAVSEPLKEHIVTAVETPEDLPSVPPEQLVKPLHSVEKEDKLHTIVINHEKDLIPRRSSRLCSSGIQEMFDVTPPQAMSEPLKEHIVTAVETPEGDMQSVCFSETPTTPVTSLVSEKEFTNCSDKDEKLQIPNKLSSQSSNGSMVVLGEINLTPTPRLVEPLKDYVCCPEELPQGELPMMYAEHPTSPLHSLQSEEKLNTSLGECENETPIKTSQWESASSNPDKTDKVYVTPGLAGTEPLNKQDSCATESQEVEPSCDQLPLLETKQLLHSDDASEIKAMETNKTSGAVETESKTFEGTTESNGSLRQDEGKSVVLQPVTTGLKKHNESLVSKVLANDLDRSKFKCKIKDCSKFFRKAKLLHYHMKYFHGFEKSELSQKGVLRTIQTRGSLANEKANQEIPKRRRTTSGSLHTTLHLELRSSPADVKSEKRNEKRRHSVPSRSTLNTPRPLVRDKSKDNHTKKSHRKPLESKIQHDDDKEKCKEKKSKDLLRLKVKKKKKKKKKSKSECPGSEANLDISKELSPKKSPTSIKSSSVQKVPQCHENISLEMSALGPLKDQVKKYDDETLSDSSTDSLLWSEDEYSQEIDVTTNHAEILDEDERGFEIIRCMCEVQEENNFMIQCEECLCWQHGVCMGLLEDDLPEKYTCYVCRNPPGQRSGLKYWYDKEWLKNGHLHGLSFLEENYSHQNAKKIVATHQLLGDVHRVIELLHGLQLKMHILQSNDHPDLKLWCLPWKQRTANDKCYPRHSFHPENRCKEDSTNFRTFNGAVEKPSIPSVEESYITSEHCYQKPRAYYPAIEQRLVVETRGTTMDDGVNRIRENGDDAISEMLGLEFGTNNAIMESDSKHNYCKIRECVPKKSSEEAMERKLMEDDSGSILNAQLQWQLNLLNHVESLQDEVTHRMDFIEKELDVLESFLDYTGELEPPEPLARLPQLKHRVKQLLMDLGKVQQIVLCCSTCVQ